MGAGLCDGCTSALFVNCRSSLVQVCIVVTPSLFFKECSGNVQLTVNRDRCRCSVDSEYR